jgi:hypothetical protein
MLLNKFGDIGTLYKKLVPGLYYFSLPCLVMCLAALVLVDTKTL